jgi:hypothetical protein
MDMDMDVDVDVQMWMWMESWRSSFVVRVWFSG